MIKIHKSETADTRSCDRTKVDQDTLEASSVSHIRDVYMGLRHMQELLEERARLHDWDKISDLVGFHRDFTGPSDDFMAGAWFKKHLQVNRHHINHEAGRRDDINLIDVIEHIVDCVMAGMARSGSVFPIDLPNEVLQKAVANTVEQFKAEIEVAE